MLKIILFLVLFKIVVFKYNRNNSTIQILTNVSNVELDGSMILGMNDPVAGRAGNLKY